MVLRWVSSDRPFARAAGLEIAECAGESLGQGSADTDRRAQAAALIELGSAAGHPGARQAGRAAAAAYAVGTVRAVDSGHWEDHRLVEDNDREVRLAGRTRRRTA